MTIDEFALREGFVKLTSSSHPNDGQTVEVLGLSMTGQAIEKVRWSFDGVNHSYKWITHEFNKGMATFSPEYWRNSDPARHRQ